MGGVPRSQSHPSQVLPAMVAEAHAAAAAVLLGPRVHGHCSQQEGTAQRRHTGPGTRWQPGRAGRWGSRRAGHGPSEAGCLGRASRPRRGPGGAPWAQGTLPVCCPC